jgi:hypothetical protein
MALQFFTDSTGKVLRARKTGSSGHIDLDNESPAVLAGCPFQPPLVDGKPAPAWSTVQYVWTLE